jgi:hypothetical protein
MGAGCSHPSNPQDNEPLFYSDLERNIVSLSSASSGDRRLAVQPSGRGSTRSHPIPQATAPLALWSARRSTVHRRCKP